MLAQLRANGAGVDGEIQEIAGDIRFGWGTDSEGNRVELFLLAGPPEFVSAPDSLATFGLQRESAQIEGIAPPSTGTIAPVMNDAAGESKNAATRPNSSGSPYRRSGISCD